ncbi:hypothetical protein ACEWY4_024106 [Coilia grayii]|uniref:Ig-like domain-containing protein n=1 Tax=Coilia grayii TaxID=363190 RepID=A0ABD1J315_9TELE
MKHCVAFTLNLLLLCAGQDLSAASSETYIVQPNDNVTLPCNTSQVASKIDTVSWLHQREDELKPVMINLEFLKISKAYTITQEDNPRATVEGETGNLVITEVNKSDLGVYHCLIRRADKAFIAEASIRLSFTAAADIGARGSSVCWALLACVGLASAFMGALVTFCINHRLVLVKSANPNTDTTANNDVKGVDVHYASVKCQGIKGWQQQHRAPDVTYATVAHHCPGHNNGLVC